MHGRSSMRYTRPASPTAGFTLVEMLVIAPIVLLTVATFVGILIYLTGETLIARTSNSLAYSVQDSLNTIEQDVTLSGSFLATNNVAITTPQGYNNNAQAFQNVSTSTGTTLIINATATTDTPNSASRQVIPLDNLPHACSSTMVNQNQVMTYNIVYFVKDNTLWRRTLMPSNYTTRGCSTPWQKPTCAPGQTGTMCVTEDMKLLDGVTSANFTVEYFVAANSTTPLTAAANPASTNTVRQSSLSTSNTATITIQATRSVAGKDVNYTGSVRVSRIGPLSEQSTPVP